MILNKFNKDYQSKQHYILKNPAHYLVPHYKSCLISCTHLWRKGPKNTNPHTHTPAGSSSRQLVSLHRATLAIRAHPSSQSYFYWQHVRAYAPPYCQDTLPLSFLLLSSVKTSLTFHTYWIHTQSRMHAERSPQGNFPPSEKLPCLFPLECYISD